MGHRHKSAPNRGSLGFRPRKRAKRESARWRAYPEWAETSDPHLMGFAGYKVGMTHVVKVEEKIRDRPQPWSFRRRKAIRCHKALSAQTLRLLTFPDRPQQHVGG